MTARRDMLRIILLSMIATLLATNVRKKELSGIESYELIHFNLDHLTSHSQLEFDLSGTHYKVQLTPNGNAIAISDPSPCHYFGTVLEPKQSANSSYLSLSLCPNRGIRGSITTINHGTEESIWIMPAAYYLDPQYDRKHLHRLTDEHLVYKSSRESTPRVHENVASISDIHLSRRLLQSNDNHHNTVELYVMSDPAHTKRFIDDYGSNWYHELKAYVMDLINGASAKFQSTEWGPAGPIEIALVELELVVYYTGDYLSLYPHFGSEYDGRTNCHDWTKYGLWEEGGCYITGNTDHSHLDNAMLTKFNTWKNQYRKNKGFDAHLLLVGNKMVGVAGAAYRGQMCKAQFNSAIVNSKYSSLESDIKAIAHVLGHTLGMTHDTKCEQCPMGQWSAGEDWNFEQQAIDSVNNRFEEGNKLKCLSNGVRTYHDNYESLRSDMNATSAVHESYAHAVEDCLVMEGVSRYYNGKWIANGTVNGRTAYKKDDQSRWLYTAIDGHGRHVWTINHQNNGGLNVDYHCYSTLIDGCSGNWIVSGTKMVNSKFRACDRLECLENNEYEETVCLYNDGSLWNDEQSKEFEIVSDECLNGKPMYRHTQLFMSYHLYYQEYQEYVDSAQTSGQWIISLHELTAHVAAKCDESDLLQCVEGKWQVWHQNNDSVEMVIDETMNSNLCLSETATKKEEKWSGISFVWIGLILLAIALALCGFCIYRSKKSKSDKFIQRTEEEVDDESEDGIDAEKTINLTQINPYESGIVSG